MTPLAYSIAKAVEVSGLSRASLDRAIRSGQLKARRSTRNEDGEGQGKYLVKHADLEAYIDSLPEA